MISDYSPALHGLIMLRGIEFNAESSQLTEIASKYLKNSTSDKYTDSKGTLEALLYFTAFSPKHLKSLIKKDGCDPWKSIIKSLIYHEERFDENFEKLKETISSNPKKELFKDIWPILPFRRRLESNTLKHAMLTILRFPDTDISPEMVFDIFAGCDQSFLQIGSIEVFNKVKMTTNHLEIFSKGLGGLLGIHETHHQPEMGNKPSLAFLEKQNFCVEN